jgi:hypothetical protein
MAFDKAKGLERFGEEGVTQATRLRFVPCDRFIQFRRGDRK